MLPLLLALSAASPALSGGVIPPGGLPFSSELASQAAIQKCGAGQTVAANRIQPLLTCLEGGGAYATAIRVAYLAERFFGQWIDYLANDEPCCDIAEMQKESQLSSNLANAQLAVEREELRFEQEEASKPQMPDYVEQHPGSCESEGIEKAINTDLTITGSLITFNKSLDSTPTYSSSINLDTSDDALEQAGERAIKAEYGLIATCYFARKDWRNALRYFEEMDSSAIHSYGTANYQWHRAMIDDYLGNRNAAMDYIRRAYKRLKGSPVPWPDKLSMTITAWVRQRSMRGRDISPSGLRREKRRLKNVSRLPIAADTGTESPTMSVA